MPALEFAALDVEATGLEPGRSEIIEVAILPFSLDGEAEFFQSFVRPFGTIPLEITRLTGIEQADVAHAPRLLDIEAAIRKAIGRRIVVGHNIGYDTEMLAAGGIMLGNDTIDTLELARLILPGLPSYSLENLGKALDLEGDGSAHRAANDVAVTVRLLRLLIGQIGRIDLTTRTRIAGLISTSSREIAELLMSSDLPLVVEDDEASKTPELRFLSTRKRPETLKPTGSSAPIDIDHLRSLFEEHGVLSTAIEGFHHRAGQEAMTVAVANAINDDGTLLVEAGTGTGKSMAYLVPAALHSLERGERVTISTNTIALQDQLFSKDIPALREALNAAGQTAELKTAVMKGRGNYLCLRRWFNYQRSVTASPADASMRGRVMIWLRNTETGDRAELNFSNDEEQAFRNVSAEGEACVASRCPFNHRNQCFLYRARRDAEAANLVIVNHALLLSDVLAENSILPESETLIIDEAHHLEDQATKQFGFSVSDASVNIAIDEAMRQDGPVTLGAFSNGADLLARTWRSGGGVVDEQVDALIKHSRTAIDAAASARRAAADFFSTLGGMIDGRGGGERSLRITDEVRDRESWSELEVVSDNVSAELRAIDRELRWCLDQIEKLPKVEEGTPDEEDRSDTVQQLINAQRDLMTQRVYLHEIVLQPDESGIYWIERGYNGRVSLHAAPLHVGTMLQERLFEKQRTSILTSATITADGSFAFIKERLGLERPRELSTPAPFDYRRSAMLFVADDLPEPNMPGYQKALEEAIYELAVAAHGRTLVLFTSYASLQQTYSGIKRKLENEGIALLAQRIDGSPRRLIERMRLGGSVVVFGAATFWEGVDIAGPALSALAIVRLPFAVPTDPVIAARSELFENPFMDYSVPQAILRFKQGFGRLIRRHEDVGVCAILDRRVVSKRYGRSFLESLPDCSVTIGSRHILGDTAAQWLGASSVNDEFSFD
jgi:DNA polymerase-3 subunit epsilon/ATP-dependent DNA helicase DinG